MKESLTIDRVLEKWLKHKKSRPKPLFFLDIKHPWNDKRTLRKCIGNSLDILRKIDAADGNTAYVIEILMLIQEEELSYSEKYEGDIPFYPSIFNDFFLIKKCQGDRFVEVKHPPEFVLKQLSTLHNLTLEMTEKKYQDFTNAYLNIQYSLDFCYQKERYVLVSSRTIELPRFKRGRRAETASNLAMYLLYIYLKEIGFRGIYEAIASLCNAFSKRFFCKGTGAPLTGETVRKRVQWVKSNKNLVMHADRLMNKEIKKNHFTLNDLDAIIKEISAIERGIFETDKEE